MKDEATTVVMLPKDLDITAAAPLAAEFLALRGRPLVVDAAAVERLGAQCAQVLISAHETWLQDGAPLSLVNASSAFVEATKLLGLPATSLGE